MVNLKLLIERKTKVPTKAQNFHLFRSDWKKIYMLDYFETHNLFNKVKSDAQFCNWIKNNFGVGIYLIIAWRKGRKGFWNFMKVEIDENKFRRLPRNPTKEEIELRSELRERKELELRKLNSEGSEREELEEDIETSDDMIQDIKKDIKKGKSGCYPYLKSILPVYSWHSLEEYGTKKKEDEFIARLI